MNGASPYQRPIGHFQHPQTTDHGYWTSRPGTPYLTATPKPTMNTQFMTPISPYTTPAGWMATPFPPPVLLPVPYPSLIAPVHQPLYATPAPAVNDLPPLVSDYDDDFNDAPLLPTPQHSPWNLPPVPPGPMPPHGYLATPVQVPHNLVPDNRLLNVAKLRALNESSIPLLHISRNQVQGRPTHWRSGYRPTARLRMKRCFAKPACASTTHTLHTLIAYKFRSNFPLMLDLRHSPMTTVFHNPERYSNTVDLYQLATTPPLHEMRLYHPLLPWDVDIRASSSSGITICDILTQLCSYLQSSIVDADYFNNVLSAGDREQVYCAYCLRNEGSLEGLAKGAYKVDFLGPQVLFRGLARTRDGWLIKTTNLY